MPPGSRAAAVIAIATSAVLLGPASVAAAAGAPLRDLNGPVQRSP